MLHHEVGAAEKQCPRCEEFKPVETEWDKSKPSSDGYFSMCKDCNRKRLKANGYVCQRAQVRAVTRLIAAHKTVYDSLYLKQNGQGWARTQLTYAFPAEYREYYLEAKKAHLEAQKESANA